MGFIFSPGRKAEAQLRLQEIMRQTKRELNHALPFAMEPVVYDFAVNEVGTTASLLHGSAALMPAGYYTLVVPPLLRQDRQSLSPVRRGELDRLGSAARSNPELGDLVKNLFDVLLPRGKAESHQEGSLADLLQSELGFGFPTGREDKPHASSAHSPQHPEPQKIRAKGLLCSFDEELGVVRGRPRDDGLNRFPEVSSRCGSQGGDVTSLECG